MAKILLAGEGWGPKATFNSLNKGENHQIYFLTNDQTWKSELSLQGYNCVNDFKDKYDLVICAGWRDILKDDILSAHRILNIHYTLLPAYRGFHGTVWAILNDEPFLGFTIHRMNKYIDDGPIIYQYKIANNFSDTAVWYMNHFNSMIEEVLLSVVNDYLSGVLPEVTQDKSKASWVGIRRLNDCCIDFNKSIAFQKSFFRALRPPYPLPFFSRKGEIFEVPDAAFHASDVKTHKGRILNIDNEGVWISCEGGYIICRKICLQPGAEKILYSYFKIGQFVNDDSTKILQ